MAQNPDGYGRGQDLEMLRGEYERMKAELEGEYIKSNRGSMPLPDGRTIPIGPDNKRVPPELRDEYMEKLKMLEKWAKEVGVLELPGLFGGPQSPIIGGRGGGLPPPSRGGM